MNTLIQLTHINAGYGKKIVLNNVNLTITERDFLGIIGPNGGGKTTLAKTLLGMLKPMSGQVTYFLNSTPVPTLRIGYLPQYNKIDKHFPISIYETVLSGLPKKLWKKYTDADHHKVINILRQMELYELRKQQIGKVSGGQLQRALLARAIVSHPKAVVLDEPDTYIDRQFNIRLYQLLNEINRRSAIIIISHDIGSVLRNVRSIACVNGTLHYHPDTELPEGWLDHHYGCPIDIVGHGPFPHRVLKTHSD